MSNLILQSTKEKEAKENQLRIRFLRFSKRFMQPCNTNRAVHMRTARFLYHKWEAREIGWPPPIPRSRKSLLFLFFKKRKHSSSFLSRKKRKQKKVNCGSDFYVSQSVLCIPATQTGRFTYEPPGFYTISERRGNRLTSAHPPPPQCLLFLFFKKRNRPLLYLQEALSQQMVDFWREIAYNNSKKQYHRRR